MGYGLLVFIVFPLLIVGGLWARELTIRGAILFGVSWFVLREVFAALGWSGQFILAVLLLDVILILKIFKGDLRIN